VKNKELLVGVFSVVVLTLLYFGFNFLKGIDFFSTTNNYYTKYNNVLQLTVSNPVLVNGFAVGRVSNIKLLPAAKNPVLVELEIDSDVILGKGAKATLSTDLLGSKTILLDLGDQKNPIGDKDTIQSDIARGMLDMITETADPVVENVQTTLRKFNSLMDNLNTTVEELRPILNKFKDTPGKINNTIDKAGVKLEEMQASFKSISEKLNLTLTELDPTLKNFKVVSDSLKKIELNKTLLKVQETLAGLTDVIAKLKKGDNTAGKLMTDDELYNNLNKMFKSIDSLANHFNSNPKHFLSPLGKSAKKIERDQEDASKKN
jgi:phospholipid/cholesterol/gamma-HCH transport system substrate-binding protein